MNFPRATGEGSRHTQRFFGRRTGRCSIFNRRSCVFTHFAVCSIAWKFLFSKEHRASVIVTAERAHHEQAP